MPARGGVIRNLQRISEHGISLVRTVARTVSFTTRKVVCVVVTEVSWLCINKFRALRGATQTGIAQTGIAQNSEGPMGSTDASSRSSHSFCCTVLGDSKSLGGSVLGPRGFWNLYRKISLLLHVFGPVHFQFRDNHW